VGWAGVRRRNLKELKSTKKRRRGQDLEGVSPDSDFKVSPKVTPRSPGGATGRGSRLRPPLRISKLGE
jgi:hypothetical protein